MLDNVVVVELPLLDEAELPLSSLLEDDTGDDDIKEERVTL